jgi:hypothetical protein
MIQAIQILYFFLFNYTYALLPIINDNLIVEIIHDLSNELSEIKMEILPNSELNEYFDESDLQQILGIDFEDNHRLQNISQGLLELTQQELENFSLDLNENFPNNELAIEISNDIFDN